MGLAQWLFYALAVFVGGWAILRFKSNLENQQRGGLALPVVGILVAVALASPRRSARSCCSAASPPDRT